MINALRAAFRHDLPIITAYLTLGVGFGVLFATSLEEAWYAAPLMGALVYTGAAQFMSVGMLAGGAGPWETGMAALLINVRHLFYGLSMLGRYQRAGAWKAYLVLTITDETFSILTTTQPPASVAKRDYYVAVSAVNHATWTLGCGIGALIGNSITYDLTGLEFMLTALFAILVYEQYKQVGSIRPLALALAASMVALGLVGGKHMLPTAMGLATVAVCGARRWLA